jgi:hypothetical protein
MCLLQQSIHIYHVQSYNIMNLTQKCCLLINCLKFYELTSGVHWLLDMTGKTDQNNQVYFVLWRQYLFYDLLIEIFVHQNYFYYLFKKYYHI